jgi:hypothetical protein
MTTTTPAVDFLGFHYIGASPSSNNNIFKVCDYCGKYKRIHILNYPIYYRKGVRRRLVSFCRDCGVNIIARDLHVVDCKSGGYLEILDMVKHNHNHNLTPISFEDAVRKAYFLDGKLKRYLYCFSQGNDDDDDDDNTDLLFDNKRVWEFRYKMQYKEPRVKAIQQDPLEVCWI